MSDDRYVIKVEAVGDTAAAQASLDKLATSAKKLSGETAAAGSQAEKSSENLDKLGHIAKLVSRHMGEFGSISQHVGTVLGLGGLAGAVGIGVAALEKLTEKLIEAYKHHKEVSELAERFELPVAEVDAYSESWIKVAKSMREVERGFADLSDARKQAFKELDLPATVKGSDLALTRVAVAAGSRSDKVDVIRILTGLSEEDANKELDAELKRLNTRLYGYRRAVAESANTAAGTTDVSQMRRTGQFLTDNELRNKEEGLRNLQDLADARREGRETAEKEIAAIDEKAAREQKQRDEQRLQDLRATMQREARMYDEHLKERREQLDFEHKMVDEFDDGGKGILQLAERAAETIGEIKVPFQDFTDTVKDAFKEMERDGSLSFKRLMNTVILSLLQKPLYAAIDKLGDALGNALGGLLGAGGGLGKFFSGIFGHAAGGGNIDRPTIVGEDGPEIALPGRNGAQVLNRRQLAFLGGGSAQGVTYAPVTHITVQGDMADSTLTKTIAYVEQARRADQQGIVRMLYNNGFGRMRG